MRKLFVRFVILVIVLYFSGTLYAGENKLIGARFPAISPDGTKIAFCYIGDIWIVPSSGGKAIRLTNHIAYDREPVWSPDGTRIAFTSNRHGNEDIYIMPCEGGVPKQMTFHTGNDVATDFSPDGEWIYFTSSRSSSSSIFKVNSNGGNALPVLDIYWSWLYDAKVNREGTSIVFSLGMENNSKWRRCFRTSNSAKIWIKEFTENKAKLIVSDMSNSFWPCWSPDGEKIYFVSDRDYRNKNIWSVSKAGLAVKSITKFTQGDVKYMKVARNKPVAVYERNFGIWITDLTTGESFPVKIDSPTETKENSTFFIENAPVSEYRISPDGKKIAAVVRGEIFILSSEGGYARNITNSSWRERDVDWDKDSEKIAFVSDKDANPGLYIVSALGDEVPVRLTNTTKDIIEPRFSPDGKWIAYYCGKRQIRLIKSDGSNDKLLVEDDFGGRFAGAYAWSPDSRFIAFEYRTKGNMDIDAVNIETLNRTALTNTAYDEGEPVWSPDGESLYFSSNRFGHSFPEFTGKWDIYRVFLEPKEIKFKEDKFENLFVKEEKDKQGGSKEEKETVEITLNLEDIDLQTERVANTRGDERSVLMSGKVPNTLYFISNMDGSYHLWKTTLKEGEWTKYEPFMTSLANLNDLQFDNSGKYLYYVRSGRIGRLDVSAKKNEAVSFNTKLEIDKTKDYEQMLGELYYTLQHYYYDENHHNIDWSGVYEQFKPVLKQVREDRDFYDYANEMIGFLNSSHTGIRAPGGERTEKPSAHLGIVWDFSGNKITIGKIVRNGPAYVHRDSISEGDELLKINGKETYFKENIWKHLNGKINKRVLVSFKDKETGKTIECKFQPISNSAEKGLFLDEWIENRRKIVKARTNDKVAYIYMRAMGRRDLEKFLKELERDAVPRKGLILDLRYNFGGNVHDRVLQALMKPLYGKWRVRGMKETPQSTFAFAHKPVVLLTNEVTLSDGEMTSNGFKELKRGKIVGNTTYGWLIFTTGVGLMNGGYFRLPFWGCYTLDGQDLETIGGVKPDIFVINDLNHKLKGEDPQLHRAIEEILEVIH